MDPTMQDHLDACDHDECPVCQAYFNGADDYEQAVVAALDWMVEDLREAAGIIKALRTTYDSLLGQADTPFLAHAYAYVMTVASQVEARMDDD